MLHSFEAFQSFLWTPCFWRKCNDKSYAQVQTKLQRVQWKYLLVERRLLCSIEDDCWSFFNDIIDSILWVGNTRTLGLSQRLLTASHSPFNWLLIKMSFSKKIKDWLGFNDWHHDDDDNVDDVEALERGSVKEVVEMHHQNSCILINVRARNLIFFASV